MQRGLQEYQRLSAVSRGYCFQASMAHLSTARNCGVQGEEDSILGQQKRNVCHWQESELICPICTENDIDSHELL